MLDVEPVAECLAAPFADSIGPDRRRRALAIEGVNSLDLVGNPGRRITQKKTCDALGVRSGEQQPDDPARGFADPVHPRQGHRLEHREDLGFDLLGCVAVARSGNVGGAAAEKVGAINATALGDRRNPAVPKRRVARETVHHQHRCGRLPRPQVIVDGTVERETLGEADGRHRSAPHRMFWGTDITKMPCSWRQCATMFTDELPWLSEEDKRLIMGEALCAWWGWDRAA